MSAQDLQALLRFLSQDAKVPLAIAIGKVKELQNADLGSPDSLAKAKLDDVKGIFIDEKLTKQILSAARRVAKKRAAGEDPSAPSPRKKKRNDGSFFSEDGPVVDDIETLLSLPTSLESETDLAKATVFTNRAPLALAFVFALLKYTMPDQPLSSRLSLAQGYISITSRARAVHLGIESGRSAEEEGFGEGQPFVTVAGQQIRVLKRWGYEWKNTDKHAADNQEQEDAADESRKVKAEEHTADGPALWALDLEALKKSNTVIDPSDVVAPRPKGGSSSLPIYTPQSARAYLMKAFNSVPSASGGEASARKMSAAAKNAEKEANLGRVVRVLEILYESWAPTLTPEELDKRTWPWYVKVRPDVEHGVAGWGGKNIVKLADIIALKRKE